MKPSPEKAKPAPVPAASSNGSANPKPEPKSPVKTATITAPKTAPVKPATSKAESAIGQKRKLSENSDKVAPVPKKKTPKETTPSTPYTIKDLTVNLVPAQIPPGTSLPTGATKKPVKPPPLASNVPPKPKASITSELEKLKNLKKIISAAQSPKEDGRAGPSKKQPAIVPEKPVIAPSPVIESGRSCGVIRTAAPRVGIPSNFSVSQLTSPVKTEPKTPHIPVIINNHRAVAIEVKPEVKPEVKSVTRSLNRPAGQNLLFHQHQLEF